MPDRRYALSGLTLSSDVPLADAAPATSPPDAHVRLGRLQHPEERVTAEEILLVGSGGRARVRRGEAVLDPGDCPAEVQAFLTGSVLGALLHLHGVFALHGSGVRTRAGAVAILGRRHAGKSTLAARLLRRGYGFLCDDVCGITDDGAGRPLAWPGLNQQRLRPAAADELGVDVPTSRIRRDKHLVSAPRPPVEGVPLRSVVFLHESERDAVQPVSVADAVQWLGRCVYRRRFLAGAARRRAIFLRCAQLAQRVELLKLGRAPGTPSERSAELLLDALPPPPAPRTA